MVSLAGARLADSMLPPPGIPKLGGACADSVSLGWIILSSRQPARQHVSSNAGTIIRHREVVCMVGVFREGGEIYIFSICQDMRKCNSFIILDSTSKSNRNDHENSWPLMFVYAVIVT